MQYWILAIFLVIACSMGLTSAFQVQSRRVIASSRSLEMKTGRRVPVQFRGEYMRRQKLALAQEQYKNSKKKDVPYFQLYVRPLAGGAWLPFAELAGDQRATAIVNAWLSGFMPDFYKGQMDRAIARSLFANEAELFETVRKNLPAVSKIAPERLVFGYTVDFQGVVEKKGEQKVTIIDKNTDQKNKTWFENITDSVKSIFKTEDDDDKKNSV